jgi:hypothetical protein
VSRSRQDIDTQILHVDIEGSGALCRVENEQSTALVGNLGNFIDRRHAARDIRDVREDDVIETIAAELAKMIEVYTECLCRFRHRDLRPLRRSE